MARHVLYVFLSERRKDIYGALMSLEATLLGFIVAVLTIVLGYAQAPRFEIVRRSPHWKNLFGSYTRAMRWAACATLTSFIGFLVDRDKNPCPPITAVCLVSVVFSGAFIARMLWVTEGVVRIVVATGSRGPGE